MCTIDIPHIHSVGVWHSPSFRADHGSFFTGLKNKDSHDLLESLSEAPRTSYRQLEMKNALAGCFSVWMLLSAGMQLRNSTIGDSTGLTDILGEVRAHDWCKTLFYEMYSFVSLGRSHLAAAITERG